MPGRFSFDPMFRFEIPVIPCDEWNSIFGWISGFRSKIRNKQKENKRRTFYFSNLFDLLSSCVFTLKLKQTTRWRRRYSIYQCRVRVRVRVC